MDQHKFLSLQKFHMSCICVAHKTLDTLSTAYWQHTVSRADLVFWPLQPLCSKAPEGILSEVPQGRTQSSIPGKVSHEAQLNLAVVCRD